jgi:hypothetical protein
MSSHSNELLREWFYKAKHLETAHISASEYYRKKDTYIAIPLIIFSAFAGSLSFTTTGIPDNIKNILLYITGGLNVLVSITGSLREYFSWSKKQYKHGSAAISYQKLKNHIEIQLSLHKMGLDIPYDSIVSETGNLFIKVDNESPQLPKHIRVTLTFSDNIMDIMVDTNTDQNEDNNDTITDIINELQLEI